MKFGSLIARYIANCGSSFIFIFIAKSGKCSKLAVVNNAFDDFFKMALIAKHPPTIKLVPINNGLIAFFVSKELSFSLFFTVPFVE